MNELRAPFPTRLENAEAPEAVASPVATGTDESVARTFVADPVMLDCASEPPTPAQTAWPSVTPVAYSSALQWSPRQL